MRRRVFIRLLGARQQRRPHTSVHERPLSSKSNYRRMTASGHPETIRLASMHSRFTSNCGLTDSDAGTALSFRVTNYAAAMRGAATNVVR